MSPIFYLLVGLPGSGKTEQAKKLHQQFGAVIHSSDKLREELYGDERHQADNEHLFKELHKRIINDLSQGCHVVYDATNINFKRRMSFLRKIKHIDCQKVCLFMATPFDTCVARNDTRGRTVPLDVIDRMYRSIWIPNAYEGWDYVELVYPDGFKPLDIETLFGGADGLNYVEQDNPHHAFTVGHHCLATYGILGDASTELQEAALLHDIGKPYTKSFVNSKGVTTETAHYYSHHNVSAYNSLFYSSPDCDRVYVATLIQWHMRPFGFNQTDDSQYDVEKFKRFIGDRTYEDIMKLHQADVLAKGVVKQTVGSVCDGRCKP